MISTDTPTDTRRVRGDEGHRDKRAVDIGPRHRASVVVDEDRLEPDLLGLLCGGDDRLGRSLEAEIIGIGGAEKLTVITPPVFAADRGVMLRETDAEEFGQLIHAGKNLDASSRAHRRRVPRRAMAGADERDHRHSCRQARGNPARAVLDD